MAPSTRPRFADGLLVLGFLLVVFLPVLDRFVGVDPTPELVEKRALREAPAWPATLAGLAAFPAAFTGHWDDTFGFRRFLVRANSYIKVLGLASKASGSVAVGREDWLYYSQAESLETFTREHGFEDWELRDWREMLAARQRWFEHRGIRSLFYIAPIKHSIYPEFMPADVKRFERSSRTDELYAELSKAGVPHVDLRPALLRAKTKRRNYHRTDTHWNEVGGAVAVGTVVGRLREYFPGMIQRSLADYSMTEEVVKGKDLSYLLGLEHYYSERLFHLSLPSAPAPKLRSLEAGRFPPGEGAALPWTYQVTEVDDPSLPVGMLFRDSFSDAMIPFLAPYFRRLVCVWSPSIDPVMVEREAPDVVLTEVVERHLYITNFRDPSSLGAGAPEADFEASAETVLRLDGSTGFEALVPGRQLTLEPGPDGLLLRCGGDDPWMTLHLPRAMPQGGVIRLALEGDLRGHVQLRAPPEQGGRIESAWLQSQLYLPGAHQVTLRIPPGSGTELRIDPAGMPSNVQLRWLEVRALTSTK